MSVTEQGAALQACNNELVRCIDELSERRDKVARVIKEEEDQKVRLLHEISILTDKVGHVSESIAARVEEHASLERTITEAKAAYLKILGSSEALLSIVRRNLVKPNTEQRPDQ